MTQPQRAPQDLGFGPVIAGETRRRFLNRDGTFNVKRTGLGFAESRSFYRYVLNMSWGRYFTQVAWWYLATNLIFAVAYLACGPGALEGPEDYGGGALGHFLKAFFFSVQTLATIGYGRIAPIGITANFIVAIESVCGLVLFALITGIAFARFSRPRAIIRFSEKAIIAPYRGGAAFMFRIANMRDNELFDVQAEVAVARLNLQRQGERLFDRLQLERDSVTFFPLSWTIVHPIDQFSPLAGVTEEELAKSEAEFVIRLSAYDETSGATVHVRSSYRWDEIVWGAKFVSVIDRTGADGIIRVDVQKISEIEAAQIER